MCLESVMSQDPDNAERIWISISDCIYDNSGIVLYQ